MAGKRLTGRQKMINLMYLVFIAMMAMNVDREVLRSFESINITLEESAKLTADNNATFYQQIKKKAEEDPAYQVTDEKAGLVKAKTNEFVNFIDSLKKELIGTDYIAGAEDTDYNSLQNTEPIVSLLFKGGKADNGNQKGQELVKRINEFQKFLLGYVGNDQSSRNSILSFFNTESKSKKQNWLNEKFYDQPMVAALTNFTKLQVDARTLEGNIVRDLLSGKLKEKIELNAFEGLFLSPGIVEQGSDVALNVVLGAYDNSLTGSVATSAGNAQIVNGKATLKLNTGSIGIHKLTGSLTYKGADGENKTVQIVPSTYQVVAQTSDVKFKEVIEKDPTGGSIVADNLRVVYRGVTNPISATINGANGAVSLVASSGNLSSAGANKWNYTPAGGNEVVFTASAKASSGRTISVRETFRIKPVPPARGNILGQTSQAIPANGLAGQTVRIDWPDFLFPITGEVTSFNVKVPGQPTVRVSGNKMSGAAAALSKAQKGDVVGVFDIKYKTNSGQSGEASSVTIEVR
ncbi:GldM family protein [uncultured Weeksella sp.]|uniref:type IX secretion system motor protein PorM/GldM n=1 Tax=uncultured Weeksella sp. TaxID=1161389 RepID=UPI00259BF0F8|nr:GldM family protein [uncultured Weeksella sp.]